MSDLDNLNCAICFLPYNNKDHIPKMLPSCGHTVCLSCLNDMLRSKKLACSAGCDQIFTEKITTNNFPNNWALLHLLEDKLQTCHQHGNATKDRVCLNDGELYCKTCVLEKSHNGHDFSHINDIKKEASTKKKKLQAILKEFESDKDEIKAFLEEGKKSVRDLIKEEFDKIRKLLDEKEKRFHTLADYAFSLEEMFMNKILEKENEIKEEYELQISDLDRDIINKRFLNTLKKTPPIFEVKKESQRVANVVQTIEKDFKCFLENFSEAFSSLVQDHQPSLTTSAQLADSSKVLAFRIARLVNLNITSSELCIRIKNDMDWSINLDRQIPTREHLSKIKRVSFGFDEGQLDKESFELIKMLCEGIEKVSNLKLIFSDSNEKGFEVLCSNSNKLWCKDKIETFDISCCGFKNITIVLNEIVNSLGTMNNLKHFMVDLGNSTLEDHNLKAFSLSLKPKLSNLLTLQLYFYETRLTDNGMVTFFNDIGSLVQNLRVLRLSLHGARITDESIVSLSRSLVPNLINIEELIFLIGETQISDLAAHNLFSSLKNVSKNIKFITLGLEQTEITDISVSSLCNNVFKTVVNLQCFELYLGFTKVTDKGISFLFESLKGKMSNVKEFILQLSKTQVTDKNILTFNRDIVQSMNILSKFDLSLDETGVSDGGIRPLINRFQQIIGGLEEFSLSLHKTNVTEASVKELRDYARLRNNHNLKAFEIKL